MTDYEKENRGSIWGNKRKTKDTHPDFTGTMNVEGREYFVDGWKRKEGASMTSARSQQTAWQQTELELTPSEGASRARTSPLQARAQALKASAAAYGRSTPELLASYDHASSSWRTSQRSLVEGWTEFSETWSFPT